MKRRPGGTTRPNTSQADRDLIEHRPPTLTNTSMTRSCCTTTSRCRHDPGMQRPLPAAHPRSGTPTPSTTSITQGYSHSRTLVRHRGDAMTADYREFLAHLTALPDVTVWVGEPGSGQGLSSPAPTAGRTWTPAGTRTGSRTFQGQDCLAMNTGLPFAMVDVDPQNGGDVAKVRAQLAELKVRIFAEIDTPGGGKHFYVAGHPDLTSTHSKADNPKLPGYPGVDIQSHGCNVFLPGTSRPKYNGRGYTIVFDELDQLPPGARRRRRGRGAGRLGGRAASEGLRRRRARHLWCPGVGLGACEPWDGDAPDKRQQAYLDAALSRRGRQGGQGQGRPQRRAVRGRAKDRALHRRGGSGRVEGDRRPGGRRRDRRAHHRGPASGRSGHHPVGAAGREEEPAGGAAERVTVLRWSRRAARP